jgi:A/G-specific adenine glycosylase
MTTKKAFQRELLNWYRQFGRDLPWRGTHDPYAILVSELMLQQTEVATVIPYYKEWLRRFPSFAALARAPESDVLHAWQGLGYYARARNLHATAKRVAELGSFPNEPAAMRDFPGVGKYTAYAVATFAFGQSVPIVEANVSRVLSRLFDLREPIDSARGRNALWNYATALVPPKFPAQYNSALLDLGATICLPRVPKCNICPVRRLCSAKQPALLPIKRPRARTKHLIERHALFVRRNKILLQPAERRWRGMWILPQLNARHKRINGAIYNANFPFTNHRITLQIFPVQGSKSVGRWFSRREIQSIPIPSPHRRAIEQLFAAA